ncbi:DUF3696 domain-containing protein [Candidatus Venteria ishoeyi]|uniref:Chromosome segregation protein n=2 Tax=Candidatus Venteria ishoeyi TaxID=1899563 RepID=A0A1H6F778_9GAMM|nr:DUF3696 domain-containing protein [Candidatus Venteria ishoeyi]SEH04904.1 chromosome segregation protein [Candidatus Venteria ishoeyi]
MKLKNIKIKNFKSLKNIDINLEYLTLITGVNSSGKSSLIQALLLLKENTSILNLISQGYKQFEEIGINTNLNSGKYAILGYKKYLLTYDSTDDNINFELSNDDNTFNIVIQSKENFDMKLSNGNSKLLDIFDDNIFCYLNTDRASPANDYPLSKDNIDKNFIGLKGEYTAHYLAERKHEILPIKQLKHPDSITEQLLENTSHWLGEISSSVSISATPYPEIQRVFLAYQYIFGENTTAGFSPLNVGFGLTYVLPVIVAILKAKPGDFVIIENPESHLHPKGQSKIAELCAIAAHHGVQMIVETHSDHFLNGLRVATKNKIINPKESQIYYFDIEKDSLNTLAHPVNIDEKGKIDNWPIGFFDEWDNQLDKLLW